MQGDRGKVVLNLKRDAKGKVTGIVEVMENENDIADGEFNADDNSIEFTMDNDRFELGFSAEIKSDKMIGDVDFGGRRSFEFTAKRVSKTAKLGATASNDDEKSTGDGSRLADLVPGPRWVSSIEASKHKAGRVYLTLDGHRSNDDEPYLFVSGELWQDLVKYSIQFAVLGGVHSCPSRRY